MLWFYLAAVFTAVFAIGDEDIRCTAKSCKDAKCNSLPAKCNSNDTNAAIYMLSPDICNCCEYCLLNLAEGDACSIGDPSNARHTSLCGPGLACTVEKADETDGTCQKMRTHCALEQQNYDARRKNGSLGSMETRATCDDDGQYASYKCILGQTCYCLRSNGTRIFGQADYSTIPSYMDCSCSRAYYDAVEILGRELHPHEHFRCTPQGSYDRLQCIGDKCLCVDASDGAPTYPNDDLVHMEKISNKTLPCYTNAIAGQYYKKCEGEYMKVYREVEQKKNETKYSLVLGYEYPQCDLDGTYNAVQENKTHKFCVDKNGVLLTEGLAKNDTAAATLLKTMNCKCVRAKLITSTSEPPNCLANGNYNPIQCRRGRCRCVDTDGNQVCLSTSKTCNEVDQSQVDTLKCS